MKIILINKFHYRRGGAETYYFDLADVLRQKGHEVHFFSMKHKENEKCDDSKYFVDHQEYVHAETPYQRLKALLTTLYSVQAKRNLEHMIQEIKPDIIHVNNYHRQLSCSIFDAAKKYNIPVVMTAHDATIICPQIYMGYRKKCTACANNRYYNCLRNKCIKNSLTMSLAGALEGYISKLDKVYEKIDCMILPSKYLADIYLKDGLNPSRIRVFPNAKKAETAIKVTADKGKYAIFFGRLSSEKGIFTLLQAVQKVDVLPIYIVGEGPEKERITEYIEHNKLWKKVKLLGYKTGEELYTLIKNAKFAIMPSETPENCPYGVMEAMMYGVPVIGANLGGIPELIDDKNNGWLFEAGNADELAILMKKAEDDADRVGQAAYRKAQVAFSTEEYYKKVKQIYDELIIKNAHN